MLIGADRRQGPSSPAALVGVVDADLGGSDGDLRARERTFQLHQVSRSAGVPPGLVLLQTRNPEDAVMQALKGDRDGFMSRVTFAKPASRRQRPPSALVIGSYDGDGSRHQRGNWVNRAQCARCKSVGATPVLCPARGQTRERLLVRQLRGVDAGYLKPGWPVKVLASVRVPWMSP